MKTRTFFLLLFFLMASRGLNAQALWLFDVRISDESKPRLAFISLSDIDPLSEHPDSLATPSLEEMESDSAKKYEHVKLTGSYRKRFLARTNVSERDKLFIYDYSSHVLLSFNIMDLDVVANLNNYGAAWPYSQYDFMIGFEITEEHLKSIRPNSYTIIACVGKEDPFVTGKMQHIEWENTDSTTFPDQPLGPVALAELESYNLKESRFIKHAVYKYEANGLVYFLQDWKRKDLEWGDARRLLVVSAKTKEVLYEGFYMDSEGTGLTPLDNQWTGPMFKNKPPVVFGFLYHSFGCPSIEFISMIEKPVYINCDNRH